MLTGRMPGVGLNAAGHDEAARLARHFADGPVSAVISSPMQRARETAGPIAARCGVGVRIEPGVDEIDFGDWTGLAFAELDGRDGWAEWNACRSLAACPGGETMLGAQARAVAAVLRLTAAPDRDVVVVSHQDVLKAVVAHMLGLPLDMLARFALDPAHRATVTLAPGHARLEGLNLPP